jgi:hypothetical protein
MKQEKLYQYYQEKFINNKISDKYSSPHLISLENSKINTDIMIIGQETNSWYGSYLDFQTHGVEKQMSIYNNFMNENYQTMNTIFWRDTKYIIDDNTIIPIWTNIFKFDLGDSTKKDKNISKASKEEYTKIIEFHQDILAKEIEIIQPRIIIFFTGHTYDKLFFDPIVKKTGDYKKLYKKIDELKDIDEWQCGTLDLKNFEGFHNFKGKAIRTYHPSYLNRNSKKFGKTILNYLRDEISSIK